MTPETSLVVAGLSAGVALLMLLPYPTRGQASRASPLIAVALASGLLLAVAAHLGLLVPGLVVGLGCIGGSRWWMLRRQRLGAEAVASQVLLACEGLAGDLEAGLEPGGALLRSARDWPLLSKVATAHQLGVSVPDTLRTMAATPGAADLRVVAAAWEVGQESGPGLATGIAQVARSLRADRATARVVAAELASARATARLLAFLPVGVLLLGSGSGGDPWRFLLQTPPGWVCLAVGMVLATVGLLWLEALAGAVTR